MKRQLNDDEEINSSELPTASGSGSEDNEGQEAYYNPDQDKEITVVKKYLDNLKKTLSPDEIAEQLDEDYKETVGTKFVNSDLVFVGEPTRYRAHRDKPTCFALGNNCFYSASKAGDIIRVTYATENSACQHKTIGQDDYPIFSLAYSADHNMVATGNNEGQVCLWNSDDGGLIERMVILGCHHKIVTGLVFRPKSTLLFASVSDGTVRVFDIEIRKCLQTLYGHQSDVMAIDFCVNAITAGSDLTVRQWKYEADKQLVFKGGNLHSSIDTISAFNSRYAISGSQDGKVCVWDMTKKKPIFVLGSIHGALGWISSVATFRYHNIFATGSFDGYVRLWKFDPVQLKCTEVSKVPIMGYINQLEFSPDGKFLAAQVSREQRFGSWLPVIKEARHGVYIIYLSEISKLE